MSQVQTLYLSIHLQSHRSTAHGLWAPVLTKHRLSDQRWSGPLETQLVLLAGQFNSIPLIHSIQHLFSRVPHGTMVALTQPTSPTRQPLIWTMVQHGTGEFVQSPQPTKLVTGRTSSPFQCQTLPLGKPVLTAHVHLSSCITERPCLI